MATTMNKENSAGVVGNSNAAAVVQQKQQKPADAKAGGKAMSIEAFDIGRQLGRGKYGTSASMRVSRGLPTAARAVAVATLQP